MGFRGYVHIQQPGEKKPGSSPQDPCIGKMFGYFDIDDNTIKSISVDYIWQALANTPDGKYLFSMASATYFIDSEVTFDSKYDMLNALDCDYRLIVRFTKLLFCEFIKAYYHDQRILCERYTMPKKPCLKQILDYYGIKLNPQDEIIYVYWL